MTNRVACQLFCFPVHQTAMFRYLTCTSSRSPFLSAISRIAVIKPYYEDDLVQLYQGDAVDLVGKLLSNLSLAAVVTDPPYASGARTEAAKPSSGAMVPGRKWNSRPIDCDQMTTTGFVWTIREVVAAAQPHLVSGGAVLSFIDWRQWPNLVGALESLNLRVNGMLVWDKEFPGLGNGFRSQHELVCYASNGTARVIAKDTGNVFRSKRVPTDHHPSPKPVGLIEKMLRVVTIPGDLVIDPFAGSGTTLLAARNLGRRCIGIERSPEHCETAATRLRQMCMAI